MKKDIHCIIWAKEIGRRELTQHEWFLKTHFLLADHLNFELHREDGPAIVWANGTKSWCIDGELHRLDGPAVERPDGTRFWYINNKMLNSKEVENWIKENNVDLSINEGQLALKLRWL